MPSPGKRAVARRLIALLEYGVGNTTRQERKARRSVTHLASLPFIDDPNDQDYSPRNQSKHKLIRVTAKMDGLVESSAKVSDEHELRPSKGQFVEGGAQAISEGGSKGPQQCFQQLCSICALVLGVLALALAFAFVARVFGGAIKGE
ncbi:hypothetical protein AURDEDRAFT_120976 [Auricularia subglabra TFB-10046 SS5]|nr:hypothetical protein AURDEDRAFT_120976 [Auricularia subglabra TFB-10046 SS5]